MEITPLDHDMFGHIIQSYENLHQRAEEIYSIHRTYFKDSYETIDDISIDFTDVTIESSQYTRGERDYMSTYFPASYLLMSDEELHIIFKKQKDDNDELRRLEKERIIIDNKARREQSERKQLEELIAKYGIPQGE